MKGTQTVRFNQVRSPANEIIKEIMGELHESLIELERAASELDKAMEDLKGNHNDSTI